MTYMYKGKNITVIAHRGDGELFNENTLDAFREV